MSRRKIVIVGGGIAGLSAALELCESADVTLLESDGRLGGKIETAAFKDRPLDLGPDAFIVRNDAALRLCGELGLEQELITPATKSAAIYSRGSLHPFPDDLVFGIPTRLRPLLASGVSGWSSCLRLTRDLFAVTCAVSSEHAEEMRRAHFDPTVAEVLQPRLGRRILASLTDPLVGGINAGDVDELSFYSCMPQIAEAIAGKKSILRALRPRRATKEVALLSDRTEQARLEHREDPSRRKDPGDSVFRGLRPGLGALVERLEEHLVEKGVEIVLNDRVEEIGRSAASGFVVSSSSARRNAEEVILTTPAFVAGDLVQRLSPELSEELRSIPYAGVAIVAMSVPYEGLPSDIRKRLAPGKESGSPRSSGDILPGSGVLVARTTSMMTTAVSFTSSKWPRSSNEGEALLRVSLGRFGDQRALELDDKELLDVAVRELHTIVGLRCPPSEALVRRWPDSFPQYASGHRARVERIEGLSKEHGLSITGAAYRGIGVPSCIANSRATARSILARND